MLTVRQDFLGAVRSGDAELLKLSIDIGADVRLRILCEQGRTALHCVTSKGFLKCVEILINSRADVNATDDEGYTPIHLAVINGHVDCVILIGEKANLNKRDGYRYTPLHWAARKGHSECVLALLNMKAKFDTSPHQRTALGWAAKHGWLECVRILCRRKANVNSADGLLCTPLASAAKNGNANVCNLLIQCMADVRLASRDGNSPLHHAAYKGSVRICKLLLEGKRIQMVSILGRTASPLPSYIHSHIAEYLYEKYDHKLLQKLNRKNYMAYHVARKGETKNYLYQVMPPDLSKVKVTTDTIRMNIFFRG